MFRTNETPHNINICQVNMIVIVMRNLLVERDLCNGTRLKVTIYLSVNEETVFCTR